jgi:RNA polymerase sigma-70 factor (ECF subfamily)
MKDRHLALVPTTLTADADEALVAGVKAGRRDVAGHFVKRVGPRAKATIRRLLRHHSAEHEDLLQVALVELVTTIGRFRGQCSLDTWTDRITAHVVFKRLRRLRLETQFVGGLCDDALLVPAADSPERRAATEKVLARVKALLGGMTEDRLTAWVLSDVHGFSLEEIADILEVSVAAAQSHVSRGRRDVRERLNSDPELADTLTGLEATA